MNLYESIKSFKEIDSMSYDELEEEISKVKDELDYCDRRDEVCATFGGDAQRYELEDRLQKLQNRLDSFDYEYDDGDTNWAAEEEADATERLERRYGSVEDSELQEDDKSDWFRGALGLQDWVKEKCHFDCRVYMRDDDQEKLDKAWNLLWNIAQAYAKPLSKYDVHASVGNKDILLDVQNKGSGGLVYRITFPDPYNGVNAFKGVSAVVHGDQDFTADWYELTQALSHIIL